MPTANITCRASLCMYKLSTASRLRHCAATNRQVHNFVKKKLFFGTLYEFRLELVQTIWMTFCNRLDSATKYKKHELI